jgi:hypothetical protein
MANGPQQQDSGGVKDFLADFLLAMGGVNPTAFRQNQERLEAEKERIAFERQRARAKEAEASAAAGELLSMLQVGQEAGPSVSDEAAGVAQGFMGVPAEVLQGALATGQPSQPQSGATRAALSKIADARTGGGPSADQLLAAALPFEALSRATIEGQDIPSLVRYGTLAGLDTSEIQLLAGDQASEEAAERGLSLIEGAPERIKPLVSFAVRATQAGMDASVINNIVDVHLQDIPLGEREELQRQIDEAELNIKKTTAELRRRQLNLAIEKWNVEQEDRLVRRRAADNIRRLLGGQALRAGEQVPAGVPFAPGVTQPSAEVETTARVIASLPDDEVVSLGEKFSETLTETEGDPQKFFEQVTRHLIGRTNILGEPSFTAEQAVATAARTTGIMFGSEFEPPAQLTPELLNSARLRGLFNRLSNAFANTEQLKEEVAPFIVVAATEAGLNKQELITLVGEELGAIRNPEKFVTKILEESEKFSRQPEEEE